MFLYFEGSLNVFETFELMWRRNKIYTSSFDPALKWVSKLKNLKHSNKPVLLFITITLFRDKSIAI